MTIENSKEISDDGNHCNWESMEEMMDESLTWAAKNPLAASILTFAMIKMGTGLINAVKNRKGSQLYLELDLCKLKLKDKPVDPMLKLWGEKDTVYYRDLLEAMELAAKDKAVAGIIVRVGSLEHVKSLSTIWELREMIRRFKEEGKKTIVHAESFGERGENILMYYLMSCFDEIHLPRIEILHINGLTFKAMFLKQLLTDKLDIDVQLLQREKFKNYANMFKEDKFTPEHKEHLERNQEYILNYIINEMAADRGKTYEEFSELMNRGFFTAEQAQQENIVTHIGYRDSVYESAAQNASVHVDKLNLMFIMHYARRFGQKYKSYRNYLPWTKKIAIVHLHGSIVPGTDHSNSGTGIFSDDATRNLRALRKEKRIQAVIIHINSPGGSATASDSILREIDLLRESGKKVVIFQSSVAASGGYWLSLAGDAVVSTPVTITGSIGVIFGKFNFQGMFKKIGITFDTAEQKHKLADFMSTLSTWNEESLKEANNMIDQYYEHFKNLVSERRSISREEVDKLAQGKVYIGTEALDLRLVDHIGGIEKAIEVAKSLIGLSKDDFAQVVNYPPQPTIFQIIMRGLTGNDDQIRNSRDQDELRRKGFEVGSTFRMLYNQFSVVPHIRRVGAMLLGNSSTSQIQQEISNFVRQDGNITANIEAYCEEFQGLTF